MPGRLVCVDNHNVQKIAVIKSQSVMPNEKGDLNAKKEIGVATWLFKLA